MHFFAPSARENAQLILLRYLGSSTAHIIAAFTYGIDSGPYWVADEIETYINGSLEDTCGLRSRGWDCSALRIITYRYTYRVTATKNGEESSSSNSATTWGEGPQRIRERTPSFASLEAVSTVPETHALNQNYPNPFNPSTEIRFDLPEAAEVLLVVYNVTGREVARLVNQSMGAGSHRVRWDAGDLPSGVYLYTLTAGNYTDTKSMTLLR